MADFLKYTTSKDDSVYLNADHIIRASPEGDKLTMFNCTGDLSITVKGNCEKIMQILNLKPY